jgi:hypothetical protein
VILVDDHLIAHRIAAGGMGSAVREPPARVATTCSWWWRLSAALSGSRSGANTRHFGDIDSTTRSALERTVAKLPDRIVILDLRDLIPAMARLSAEHNLNLLAAEAVVAAEILGAELVVRQDTPKIRDTAAARGIRYRLDAAG